MIGHGCLSLRQVEQQANWSTQVTQALVDTGLLSSQLHANPINRAEQRVVHPIALAAFLSEYVSLNTLATERGAHFLKLKQQIEAAQIPVAEGFDGIPATFYRRKDLTRLG